LDWVILTIHRRSERVKVVVRLIGSLSSEGIMKVQADLMATMDELVNDSFQGASERDLLVEYECSRGKFSREQEPMEVLDRIIKTMQHKMFRVKALLEQVLQP
jgi:hypothetical protein